MLPGFLKLKNLDIDLKNINTNDLDRKCKQEMVEQPPISRWCVFYNSRDEMIYNQLETEIRNCATQTNYTFSPPEVTKINSNRLRDWENAVQGATRGEPQPKLVLMLLPGRMKKGENYHELKSALN